MSEASTLAVFWANPPVVMTPEQAAAYLQISPRHLWNLSHRSSSGLKRAPVGRSVRYRRADLDRYLDLQVKLAA